MAQLTVESSWSSKGTDLKIGNDHLLAGKIESMLLGTELKRFEPLCYSPDAIVMHFEAKGWPSTTRISSRTIYNYVERELFQNVSLKDLPRKGSKPKTRHRRIEKRLRAPECKRIDQRSKASGERSEAGHWEMDCIESSKKDKSCLSTLIDRYSREGIILKLGR